MIKFKGFDDWVPVFQGGSQTDSAGRVHDGTALIDKAVATFNAARHEPPVVIGHPEENAPAYGWVEGLKKQGDLLLAKFKQVEPSFADMVKRGLFKKRSAAFYPDGSLRHIGFLGAMPPAIKGLPDVAFADGETAIFEFSEYQGVWAWEAIASIFGRMRDYLIEQDGVEKADRVIGSYEIQQIADAAVAKRNDIQQGTTEEVTNYIEKKEEHKMNFTELVQKMKELLNGVEADAAAPGTGKTFSEADVEAQKKQAADEAALAERKKLTAEFAEQAKTARQDARRNEIAVFCKSMVKSGKMTPAMVKFGVPEFMAAFAEQEDVLEFGEAKEKATLYDRFKAFFETELPKVVEFKELATRDRDTGGQGQTGAKVEALIQAKLKDNKALTYGAAFSEVQRENPDLVREYQQEFGG